MKPVRWRKYKPDVDDRHAVYSAWLRLILGVAQMLVAVLGLALLIKTGLSAATIFVAGIGMLFTVWSRLVFWRKQ